MGLSCPLCDFVTFRKEEMTSHFAKQHLKLETNSGNESHHIGPGLKPGFLGAKWMSKKLVSVKVLLFGCLGCSFETDDEDDLKRHVEQVHLEPERSSSHGAGPSQPQPGFSGSPRFSSFDSSSKATTFPARAENISRKSSDFSRNPTNEVPERQRFEAAEARINDEPFPGREILNRSLLNTEKNPLNVHILNPERLGSGILKLEQEEVSFGVKRHSVSKNKSDEIGIDRQEPEVGKADPELVKAGESFDEDLDFLCAFCDFKSESWADLTRHISSTHESEGPSPKRPRTSSEAKSPRPKEECSPKVDLDPKLAQFSCHLCSHQTNSSLHLMRHIRLVHLNDKDFTCDGCDKDFSDKVRLDEHQQEHSEIAAGVLNCSKYYPKKADLNSKLKYDPRSSMINCSTCNYSSSDRSEAYRHAATAHSFKRRFGCRECHQDFVDQVAAIRHWNKTHKPAVEAPVKAEPKLEFECRHCDFKSHEESQLVRHNKLYHSSSNCRICWTLLPSQEVLKRHMKERHSDVDDGDRKFGCDACDYTTQQKASLERHVRFAHLKINFDCSSCRRSFSDRRRLWDHHRATRVTLEDGLKVDLCQLYSFGSIDLDKIQSTSCTRCVKRFPTLEEAKAHFGAKHSKVKQLICKHCGDAFKTPAQVHEHLLWNLRQDFESVAKHLTTQPSTRMGDEPDPLRVDTSLGPSEAIKTEEKTIKAENSSPEEEGEPFSCPECRFKFSDEVGLRHHIKSFHPKMKKHQCEFCSRKYSRKCELKAHLASNKTSDSGAMDCTKYLTISNSPAFQITEDSEKSNFRCQLCNFSSTSKILAMNHCTETHKGFGYHVCSKCKVWPGSKKDVIGHWSLCQM